MFLHITTCLRCIWLLYPGPAAVVPLCRAMFTIAATYTSTRTRPALTMRQMTTANVRVCRITRTPFTFIMHLATIGHSTNPETVETVVAYLVL